jgi:hypothetical protein
MLLILECNISSSQYNTISILYSSTLFQQFHDVFHIWFLVFLLYMPGKPFHTFVQLHTTNWGKNLLCLVFFCVFQTMYNRIMNIFVLNWYYPELYILDFFFLLFLFFFFPALLLCHDEQDNINFFWMKTE